MKRLIVCIFVVVLASCGGTETNVTQLQPKAVDKLLGFTERNLWLSRYHDDEKHVTCWIIKGASSGDNAISCIPDSQLKGE